MVFLSAAALLLSPPKPFVRSASARKIRYLPLPAIAV
jgi:hypothetical protein